jgi:hypothetical protein
MLAFQGDNQAGLYTPGFKAGDRRIHAEDLAAPPGFPGAVFTRASPCAEEGIQGGSRPQNQDRVLTEGKGGKGRTAGDKGQVADKIPGVTAAQFYQGHGVAPIGGYIPPEGFSKGGVEFRVKLPAPGEPEYLYPAETAASPAPAYQDAGPVQAFFRRILRPGSCPGNAQRKQTGMGEEGAEAGFTAVIQGQGQKFLAGFNTENRGIRFTGVDPFQESGQTVAEKRGRAEVQGPVPR